MAEPHKHASIVGVRELATELFKKFGIENYDLSISKRTGIGYLARCWPKKRLIEISVWLIMKHPEQVEETLRHEIAHSLDYIKFKKIGHGPTWKMCCVITGASPERTCASAQPLWRVKGECPECKKVFYRIRTPRNVKVCSACNTKKITFVRPIKWVALSSVSVKGDLDDL